MANRAVNVSHQFPADHVHGLVVVAVSAGFAHDQNPANANSDSVA